jgi:hypothetical protein
VARQNVTHEYRRGAATHFDFFSEYSPLGRLQAFCRQNKRFSQMPAYSDIAGWETFAGNRPPRYRLNGRIQRWAPRLLQLM